MFDDHYAEATPFQRVKYGVISVAGAGTGVERARSCIILRVFIVQFDGDVHNKS